MAKHIEKHWPLTSILLLLVLLTCLLVWPNATRPLGLTVLLVSILAGIILVTQKHVRAYRQGQLDRATLVRNLIVEISGILLTFAVVLFLAGRLAQAVGLVAGNAAEVRWPGLRSAAGLLAGVLVGLVVGLVIGLFVQNTWGRLVKRPRVRANQA